MEVVEKLILSDVAKLMLSSVPVGLLCGFILIIVGLVVSGILKIFKKV